MANICSNSLYVEGEEEDLEQFNKDFLGTNNIYLLYNIVEIEPEDAKFFDKEKNEWVEDKTNQNFWRYISDKYLGTQWDLECCDYYEDGCYSFNTPWGPPNEAFYRIVKKYPKLSFKMVSEESGMEIFQKFEGEGGELIFESEYTSEEIFTEKFKDGFYGMDIKYDEIKNSIKEFKNKKIFNDTDLEYGTLSILELNKFGIYKTKNNALYIGKNDDVIESEELIKIGVLFMEEESLEDFDIYDPIAQLIGDNLSELMEVS